jgi:predicted AlkP superfamily phosphohydrolase/phosphomutase
MDLAKVFVIGLDGATFDLLQPWIEEGELPNLRRTIEDSSYGRLESTLPPISPPAWASFMTGVNPGKHGIYDFIRFKPNSFEKVLVNASDVRSKRFWDLAGAMGKKSIILYVPLTYPPWPVDGIMISGIPVPSQGEFIYPGEVGKELEEKVGSWWVEIEGDRFREFDERSFLKEIDRSLQTRFNVASYFLMTKDWDLFILVIMETDMAQHMLWKEKERCLLPLWRKIDGMLGSLQQNLNREDNFIILSDHGFGPMGKTLYLNTWLREKGFLKSRKQWVRDGEGSEVEIFHRERKGTFFQKVKGVFKKPKPVIDWSKTEAYFFNTGQLQGIGINLKGREPNGIVTPTEYDEVRNRVIMELNGLMDERQGKKIVKHIFRREEIYRGPFVVEAPDIVFVSDYGYMISDRIRDETFKERGHGRGVHRLHGIFVIRGPGIKKGNPLEEGHLLDVAPTILHLLGVPVPRGFDGKVLTDALMPSFLKSHPLRFEDVPLEMESAPFEMNEEEVELIKMKLRGLGYIE